jgi:hypothetical protein
MATQTLFNAPSKTYAADPFTSPTYTVPAGVTSITTSFTIAAADASDPTKNLSFECDRFDVASQTWKFDHGFTWVGGQVNPKTGLFFQPSVTVDQLSAGTQLRAIISNTQPLTTAILVTAQ